MRSGRAFTAPAGSVVRFSIVEGPQVLDLNLWSADDPRERFWAARTRQFYGAHVTTGHRLWSNLPFLRPLVTIVSDTLALRPRRGPTPASTTCSARAATRTSTSCSRARRTTSTATRTSSARSLPYGLTELDVHDVINIFQVTGLMPDDERYFMKTCPATVGDHFEVFCETDLLLAASTCPGGDLARAAVGAGRRRRADLPSDRRRGLPPRPVAPRRLHAVAARAVRGHARAPARPCAAGRAAAAADRRRARSPLHRSAQGRLGVGDRERAAHAVDRAVDVGVGRAPAADRDARTRRPSQVLGVKNARAVGGDRRGHALGAARRRPRRPGRGSGPRPWFDPGAAKNDLGAVERADLVDQPRRQPARAVDEPATPLRPRLRSAA